MSRDRRTWSSDSDTGRTGPEASVTKSRKRKWPNDSDTENNRCRSRGFRDEMTYLLSTEWQGHLSVQRHGSCQLWTIAARFHRFVPQERHKSCQPINLSDTFQKLILEFSKMYGLSRASYQKSEKSPEPPETLWNHRREQRGITKKISSLGIHKYQNHEPRRTRAAQTATKLENASVSILSLPRIARKRWRWRLIRRAVDSNVQIQVSLFLSVNLKIESTLNYSPGRSSLVASFSRVALSVGEIDVDSPLNYRLAACTRAW